MHKTIRHRLNLRALICISAACTFFLGGSAFGAPVSAQSGEAQSGAYDLSKTPPASMEARALQFRRAGSRDKIRPPIGWQVESYATDLGDASSICAVGEAHLYVLDKARGRLYELWDRDGGGKMDVKRPVLRDLISPEDIACADSGVYIASATDILYYDPSERSLTAYVSLRNLDAQPSPRKLLLDGEGQALYLSFAPQPGSHKLVKIDIATRRAENVTSGEGTITALAKSGGSPIWAGIDSSLQPLNFEGLEASFNARSGVRLAQGSVISSITLPGSYAGPPELEPWAQDIFITQGGEASFSEFGGPLNVATIKTAFGQPKPELQIFADGFTGKHGRTAWGEPSALHIDGRGLFLTDRQNGILWRIFPAPPPDIKPEVKADSEAEIEPEVEASKTK